MATKRNHTLLLALALTIATRVAYATFSPFAPDFPSWVSLGIEMFSGNRYFGVYTGPAFFYALAFGLWTFIGGDPTVATRLSNLYQSGPMIPGPYITPDMWAFTLVMKIPFLVFDLAIAFLIIRMVSRITDSPQTGLTAGILWEASPLVSLSGMFSTGDIYPALLILLGSYMIYQSRIKLGSLCFGLGTILRLSPLLISWIYVAAFLRLRKWRDLASFVLVQLAVLCTALAYVIALKGPDTLFALLSPVRPGLLVVETLQAMGPYFGSGISLNPYQLGISSVLYLVVAYFFTKKRVWSARPIGSEALAIFCVYFAFAPFFPIFVIWMLPLLTAYSCSTNFGKSKFLIVTLSGLATILASSSIGYMGSGRALFLVPNLNAQMAYASSLLSQFDQYPVLTGLVRSIFSGMLLFLLFWITSHSLHDSARELVKPSG